MPQPNEKENDMSELIENAVTLADIAKETKGAPAKVEADARDLNLFIGCDWAGRPALSVVDAHALVSGDARRAADHSAAHLRWRAATEAWEAERDQARQQAHDDTFNTARRRGVGDPAAAHEAAVAATGATLDYEKSTPQPVFGDAESSPRLFTQKMKKVKEAVVR